MEAELKNLKIQYRTRVDGIRAHTSMRIEALESALIETKLRLNRERERAEMTMAEMESRTMNLYVDSEDQQMARLREFEKELKKDEEDDKTFAFKDLTDAGKVQVLERYNKRVYAVIDSNMKERSKFINKINELTHQVEQDREQNEKSKKETRKNLEFVLDYQMMLYGLLEQTGLMN